MRYELNGKVLGEVDILTDGSVEKAVFWIIWERCFLLFYFISRRLWEVVKAIALRHQNQGTVFLKMILQKLNRTGKQLIHCRY